MAGAGALVSVFGGLMGNQASQASQAAAMTLQQNALNNLQNINTPEAQQLALALQKYQSAGQLSPEMEGVVSQGASAMNNIQTDPRLMNAEMQSMDTLAKTGSGALRPEDMAAIQQIKNASNSQARGQQQAILQSMQARGMGGSGAQLAAQLSNGQNAANMANAQDLNVGSNASQRALQAIAQRGALGFQIQGQQFGQQAQVASANDAINRYNAINSQQVGNSNVASKNSAQASNLANLQNISNMNTGVANQQATYNAQLPQQIYQDQLAKSQAALGETNTLANTNLQNAANTQSMWSGAGQGVGQGINAYQANAQNQANQANQNNYNQQYLDILKGNQGGSGSTNADGSTTNSSGGWGSNTY